MAAIQLFQATLDGMSKLEESPFRREKDLQGFIEKHLSGLFGIEFFATELSIGPHDNKRIDTLGIDPKGRPVVIEYKLRGDQNIISQGLGYLDRLKKNPDSIKMRVVEKYDKDRVQRIDLKNPRLLCIAGAFTDNDKITAEKCTESVELIRYSRYGDSNLILEWVYGDEARRKEEKTRQSNQVARKTRTVKTPDFSIYTRWDKAGVELRQLFSRLQEYVVTLGNDVQVNPTKSYISFRRKKTVAYVKFQTRKNRLIVLVRADLERVLMEEGFTREMTPGHHYPPSNMEIIIRNETDLERAKPLLLRSYEAAG